MGKDKDKIWEHCEQVGRKIKCKYCKEEFTSSITRMKYHIGRVPGKDIKPCVASPDSAQNQARDLCVQIGKKKKNVLEMLRAASSTGSGVGNQPSSVDSTFVEQGGGGGGGGGGSGSGSGSGSGGTDGERRVHQTTLYSQLRKTEKANADLAIAKHFVTNNIAFNVARTPEFIEAMKAVAEHGPGYVPPSSETIRTSLLCTLKEKAANYVKEIKESWAETGCTIMSDGWRDMRSRNHLNLLASSSRGTVFLCSESTEGKVKDGRFLADFITRGIDEHVGRENVVQIITDNASNYNVAGALLEDRMPHVFKSNCAAHCIDLLFEDIDKEIEKVKETVRKGGEIKKFIYRFTHVLDCMRSHTMGREIKRPVATRFATNFIMLESIIKLEQPLRFMVASNEWRSLSQTKTTEGREVTQIIQDNLFWEDGREVIEVMEPLIKVLRMVDSEGGTFGYIFEAMDRAKEAISKYYNGEKAKYEPYWTIIDKRWILLHHPMHAMAALLNPHLYYDKLVKHDEETEKGIAEVLRKMFAPDDICERETFSSQLVDYMGMDSNIFSSFAKMTLRVKHPSLWWKVVIPSDKYGELRRVAMRLLSQPCSASACERNWSAFDAAHTKKRNRLKPQTLNDLVYVRVNLHLQKFLLKNSDSVVKPIYLDHITAFKEVEEDALLDVDGEDEREEERGLGVELESLV